MAAECFSGGGGATAAQDRGSEAEPASWTGSTDSAPAGSSSGTRSGGWLDWLF